MFALLRKKLLSIFSKKMAWDAYSHSDCIVTLNAYKVVNKCDVYLVQAIWIVCSAVIILHYDIFRMINFLVFMAGMEHSEKTQRIPKGLSKCYVFSLACPFSAETKQGKWRKLKEIFLLLVRDCL